MTDTIQKRISEDKQKLLEQLKQVPIIQVACQKCSLGRATYYRWRKESKKFAQTADSAIDEGKKLINDLAESKLISAIQDQNMTGIIFWLKNNSSHYTDKVELTHKLNKDNETLSPEQKELIEKALKLTNNINLKKEVENDTDKVKQ